MTWGHCSEMIIQCLERHQDIGDCFSRDRSVHSTVALRSCITNSLNMNKMLIVLLAVCLVSTQAFVKRDAPAAVDNNFLETMQKKIQDFSKDFNSQLTSTFDPEKMKKNLESLAESVNKAMSDMKSKPAA